MSTNEFAASVVFVGSVTGCTGAVSTFGLEQFKRLKRINRKDIVPT
jgi:hypothetical protein